MEWFNQERTKTVLTFPVETMALLTENGDYLKKARYPLVGELKHKSVFDKIRNLKKSARGELEVTDLNNAYLKENTFKLIESAAENLALVLFANFKEFPSCLEPTTITIFIPHFIISIPKKKYNILFLFEIC